MEKISVIVPIYNAEKFIHRCIDSIIQQTYHNIEIILVDDGSQDHSGNICDQYAQVDERIKVIHQNNAGVSSARNLGLDNATGDYVHFVDADDWVEKEIYEEMMYKVRKYHVDAVRCLQNNIYPHKSVEHRSIKEEMIVDVVSKRYELIDDVFSGKQWPSLYLMLMKKSVIDENHIRFNTDLIIGEDLMFLLQIYSTIKSMYWCNQIYYNYYIHEESAMNSTKRSKLMAWNLLVLYNEIQDFLKENAINDANLNNKVVLYIFRPLYKRIRKLIYDNKDKEMVKDLFKDTSFNCLINQLNYEDISLFTRLHVQAVKCKNIHLFYFLCRFHGSFIH